MAYDSREVLRRPDLNTRALFNRQARGERLSPADDRRIAERMGLEEDVLRRGGSVEAVLPRATSAAVAYNAGYGGMRPATPVSRVAGGAATNYGRLSVPMTPTAPTAPKPAMQPGATANPTPIPTAPRTFSRPLFSGESAMIDGRMVRGGPQPAAQSSLVPITGAEFEANAARNAAMRGVPRSPVTPVAREQSNPLTGTAPTAPQGATQDLSASLPTQFFGGDGRYRQSFRTQESANIYDSYVKSLFVNQQTAGEAAPMVQRARSELPRSSLGRPSSRVDDPQRKRSLSAAGYP